MLGSSYADRRRWAAASSVVTATVVVVGALGATLASACGDGERDHAPLPDAGVTSSSASGTAGDGVGASGPSSTGPGGVGVGGFGGGRPSTCHNGAQDGDELAVDCGGSCIAGCPVGTPCTTPDDCETLSCVGSTCADATCIDQVQNGDETDQDCGGNNCPDCMDGQKCLIDQDCSNGVCDDATLLCTAPTCTDGVKNGGETDVDCGGVCLPTTKCSIGKMCSTSDDCEGNNCIASQCACPTGMIIVPIAGEGTYCIDQVEVTYKDYTTFYQANPAGPQFKPSPQCDTNPDYTPSTWPPTPVELNRPVVAMDWCDAFAYCVYVGKRLCGNIGGGPSAFADFADSSQSEWFNACTANGANDYPYGDIFDMAACNGVQSVDGGSTGTVDVKLDNGMAKPSTTCIGGVSTFLFHMSGNASEWEDSCDGTGPSDLCHVRGGSFQSLQADLACAGNDAVPRIDKSADRGFRCCL